MTLSLNVLSKACRVSLLLTGLMVQSAFAKVAGYNVILLHGFQPQQLIWPPTSEEQIQKDAEAYWSNYWQERSEATLAWNSAERIEGNNALRLFEQLNKIHDQGTCQAGCILVTHSTGDLVARYLLDHQEEWFELVHKTPLPIVATLDFAGAGGGTELADYAISLASSDAWYLAPIKAVVSLFIPGGQLTPESLGILYDLQPSVARNISPAPSSVPRLRFVGGGNPFYIRLIDYLIKGVNDGVVPVHSACGASSAEHYSSCSPNLASDGEVKDVEAPTSFFHNHYPVIMGDDTHHGGSIQDQKGVNLTLIQNYETDNIKTDFTSETFTKGPWYWSYEYLLIPNSDAFSMSEIVVNHLNKGSEETL